MNGTTELLVEMANFAIQEAKKAQMDGTYINASCNNVFSTRFANSAIHQNFRDLETKLNINVIKGQKRLSMSTNTLRKENISWIIDRASKMVKVLPNDPSFPGMLLDPQEYPKLQLNDPTVKNLSAADLADKIVAGINLAHESSDVQTVSGNLNLKDGAMFYMSSEGHEILTPVTDIKSTVNVMANDGQGESRSNSSFGGRQFSELQFEKESRDVAERAILGLSAQEIEPKAYPTILDFQAAADQMFHVGFALSARFVVDQISFLKDKIGEQVFSDSMTVVNDPHNPKYLGSKALDSEGVATQKSTLIRNGILENLAHDRLSANRMGTTSNGCSMISPFYGLFPFPFALAVEPGQKSRQQLIEGMDDGLLVTNLHYTNFIDRTRGTETGMTKDGLFIIKNGETIGAARNLRFTDSIPKMFSAAEMSSEVSQVISFFGAAFVVPSIQIDTMSFSSKAAH